MTGPTGHGPVADLDELRRRAVARTVERASGADLPGGHIVCRGLVRLFKTDGVEVMALQGLDLSVERGELVAIVGASGSGKSTLLNILSGLDRPTAGMARVGGCDLLTMSARQRLGYRRHTVGFVWQQTARNLLPYLTARENVELPARLAPGRRPSAAGRPGPRWRGSRWRRDARRRAGELLDLVGVGYCADRRPGELSGGEQQRCAVAVAVANDPEVLFADEPTGELDQATGGEVFQALRTINTELGTTIVVVTHDAQVSTQVRRTVAIRDGRTASEVLRSAAPDTGACEVGAETTVTEYAVLDRAGRMQLPAGYVDALGLRDRVRLALEPDHIQIRPADDRGEVETR